MKVEDLPIGTLLKNGEGGLGIILRRNVSITMYMMNDVVNIYKAYKIYWFKDKISCYPSMKGESMQILKSRGLILSCP